MSYLYICLIDLFYWGFIIKGKITIICIILIMLSISLCGCDELEGLTKDEYISVTAICEVRVYAIYKNDPHSSHPVVDASVEVSIVKDGGERIEKTVLTNYNGITEKVSKTFKLYNKQPIVCYANVVLRSVEENYPGFVFNSAMKTIPWDDIYPLRDFGESTTRTIKLTIIGTETT